MLNAAMVEVAGPDDGDVGGPLRRCLVTRMVQPKEAMIRFVLGPDGTVVPDLGARLPGRGMWLSAKAAVLEEARAKRLFSRAAKAEARVPDGLAAAIVAGLERRVADTLGLARRAGQAVGGFVKAREWVAGGRAALVVMAQDGAADGRRKLLAGSSVPAVAPLDAAALGAAFGREHVVHVALAPGRLAEAVKVEAARLAGMRGNDAAAGPGGNSTHAGVTDEPNDAS
ncbi:RNA-binding protein [Elioraea sp.]|uniref:RNA-binding protein n=1 Tax=Elioraea sp. TaxID=2185103 RepID=UPI0025C11742|nr:RNA-binding protein [Elioraea sp.]